MRSKLVLNLRHQDQDGFRAICFHSKKNNFHPETMRSCAKEPVCILLTPAWLIYEAVIIGYHIMLLCCDYFHWLHHYHFSVCLTAVKWFKSDMTKSFVRHHHGYRSLWKCYYRIIHRLAIRHKWPVSCLKWLYETPGVIFEETTLIINRTGKWTTHNRAKGNLVHNKASLCLYYLTEYT